MPAAAQASLVPAPAVVCLAQTALEAACLAQQAHLLLGLACLLLDQATQVLEGELVQYMMEVAASHVFQCNQHILMAFPPLSTIVLCISPCTSKLIAPRFLCMTSITTLLHTLLPSLQVWSAAKPARPLWCIATATATKPAAAQCVWCVSAATAVPCWFLWYCAGAAATAGLQHHTACSRGRTSFSGDCSYKPRL